MNALAQLSGIPGLVIGPRSRRLPFLAALVAVLPCLAGLLLQGCYSTTITSGAGFSVLGTKILQRRLLKPDDRINYDVAIYRSPEDNAALLVPPSAIRLTDRDFVLLRRTADDAYLMERLGDSLNVLWSSTVEFKGVEILAGFFNRSGKLTIITTRFKQSDTVQAVARVYDDSNGKMTSEKVLDSQRGNYEWIRKEAGEGFGMYSMKYSPDSSKILLYNFDYDLLDAGVSHRAVGINALVVDPDMNVEQKGRCDFIYHNGAADHFSTVAVANSGAVFVMGLLNSDTLAVARHDLRSGTVTRMSYVHDLAEVDGVPSILRKGLGIHIASNDAVDIAVTSWDSLSYRFASLAIVRFDAGKDRPTVLVNNKFDQRTIDELIDKKFLVNFDIRDLTVTPKGNYVVSLEKYDFFGSIGFLLSDGGNYIEAPLRKTSYGYESSGDYNLNGFTAGPLLFLSFHPDGSNNWQAVLDKKLLTFDLANDAEYNSRLDRNGLLQILYDGGLSDGVVWKSYDPETGNSSASRQMLDIGYKNHLVRAYTLWLSDDTVVVAATCDDSETSYLVLFKIRLPHNPIIPVRQEK